MNKEELKGAKCLGKVCPITDGLCNRKCGYGCHITIKRAKQKLIGVLGIQDEKATFIA